MCFNRLVLLIMTKFRQIIESLLADNNILLKEEKILTLFLDKSDSLDLGGEKELQVIANPNLTQYLKELNSQSVLRGIINNNTLYISSGAEIIHDYLQRILSYNKIINNDDNIHYRDDGKSLYLVPSKSHSNLDCPAVRRLFQQLGRMDQYIQAIKFGNAITAFEEGYDLKFENDNELTAFLDWVEAISQEDNCRADIDNYEKIDRENSVIENTFFTKAKLGKEYEV